MPGPAVELLHVGKTYREGDSERAVLSDVSLAIEPGEIVVLVGRSGSGKSTLLNLIAGIDRPTAGRVVVDGTDLTALDEDARARFPPAAHRLRLQPRALPAPAPSSSGTLLTGAAHSRRGRRGLPPLWDAPEWRRGPSDMAGRLVSRSARRPRSHRPRRLLVGRVRGDAVHLRAEGRGSPERVNLARVRPTARPA